MCTYAINQEHNGIEITFDVKPSETIRTSMKELGFRWHRQKQLWYAKKTQARLELAEKLSGNAENPAITAEETGTVAPTENAYGIKVGDILWDSWGYNMTLVEFYKVTRLLSRCRIEIVELGHIILEDNGPGGQKVMPDIDFEVGDKIVKRIVPDRCGDNFHIKIDECVSLTPWDGNAKYQNTWD